MMKQLFIKYKVDLYKFLELGIGYVGFFLVAKFCNDSFFLKLIIGLFIGSTCYSFYTTIRYRSGKAKYILFPTINAEYVKTSGIIFGSAFIFGGIILYIVKYIPGYAILAILYGVLVLLVNIFSGPDGQLEIKADFIKIFGRRYKFDQMELQRIEIFKEKLLIVKKNGQFERIDNLNIDFEYAGLIYDYITVNKKNTELTVKNNIANIDPL